MAIRSRRSALNNEAIKEIEVMIEKEGLLEAFGPRESTQKVSYPCTCYPSLSMTENTALNETTDQEQRLRAEKECSNPLLH